THCLGGMRRVDITPPVGAYHRMWGAATHDRSTGVHRPLEATVLALRADGTRHADGPATQVVVAIDHCLMWTEDMDAVGATVAANCNLAPDELQIAFTHTHAAGLMDPARADLPGGDLIAPYLAEMTARVSSTVNEALVELRPATIVYGRGRCSLAAHRDF